MHALREKVEVQQRQLELEAAKAKKLERGLRAATRAKPRSSSSSSQHLSVRGVGGSSGRPSLLGMDGLFYVTGLETWGI